MPGPLPLPEDGIVGRLTSEQTQSLKETWKHLIEVVDALPEEGIATPLEGSSVKARKTPAPTPPSSLPTSLHASYSCLYALGRQHFLHYFFFLTKMDSPDAILLRFLRARKWDPIAGVDMLASCVAWRMERRVDEVMRVGEEGSKELREQVGSGTAYAFGRDKGGRPVIYIHVSNHAAKLPQNAIEDFVLYQVECARFFLNWPAEKATIVFNLKDFGLANMDFHVVTFLAKCLERYYPESLNCVLICNAPWIFSSFFNLICPLLDPVIQQKIQFVRSKDDLLTHISDESLISELGGSALPGYAALSSPLFSKPTTPAAGTPGAGVGAGAGAGSYFRKKTEVKEKGPEVWSAVPVVDGENAGLKEGEGGEKEKLLKERYRLGDGFIASTKAWIASTAPDDSVSPVLSVVDTEAEAGKRELGGLTKERAVWSDKLRVNYFELDGRVRARTTYDRRGEIGGDGTSRWLYKEGREEKVGQGRSQEDLKKLLV